MVSDLKEKEQDQNFTFQTNEGVYKTKDGATSHLVEN